MSSPSQIHLAWPTTTAIRGERLSSPALSTAMLPRRVAPADSKIAFIGSPSTSTASKIRFPRSGINQYPLHRLAFHRLHTPVSPRDSSTWYLTFAARIPRPLAFPFPRTNRGIRGSTQAHTCCPPFYPTSSISPSTLPRGSHLAPFHGTDSRIQPSGRPMASNSIAALLILTQTHLQPAV
ncbi:hypothetical protein CCHR01_04622 [Colletotrichum chrysophilum]|uniref:Uncharacterized protein n=1 Tax=Colletotrichum chrysophilum TaxID=1836956 RepID=A0AAD9AQS4_9PEZI|nr:hypothetical protein CCHR01_04622 [Colletotrichum chrysophilum]